MMAGDENRHFEMIYIDELADMLAAYPEKRMPVEIKAVTNNLKVRDYVKMAYRQPVSGRLGFRDG